MIVSKVLEISDIRPIHPFPARMAPSIIWESVPRDGRRLRVLDPMAGSGTTLVSVRAMGHQAIGCDTDPLALLIGRSWCSDFSADRLKHRAEVVLERATKLSENIEMGQAYPSHSDLETKEFLDYWFDGTNRRQLTSLAKCISRIRDVDERALLWCAFSRLIITKKIGVSLAMDISHSRPHKKYEEAPVRAFDRFLQAVDYINIKAPFNKNIMKGPAAIVRQVDARSLPFRSGSMDMIITSPPYPNAIDYIRGHKFSLVWMGYSIGELRALRSNNIGGECCHDSNEEVHFVKILERMGDLKKLDSGRRDVVSKYLSNMNRVISECRRVLKKNGQAIFVIGDSTIDGVFVSNSEGLIGLAKRNGLKLRSKVTRSLPENRRYLPPPTSEISGHKLQGRMREEVVLSFG